MPDDPIKHSSRLAEARPVQFIRHVLQATTAAVVFGYALIICAQVFYRYVLNSSLIWSEELVRYGLLWGVMLGAALASDRNAHVALDPLRDMVSVRTYRAIAWIAGLLILIFCVIVAWYGWEYLYRLRLMRSPASQIPMMYVYAAIPVGCVLIAFFSIIHLFAGTYLPDDRGHEEQEPATL